MMGVPLLNEDDLDLLVAYSIGDGEEITEAILEAFQSARIRIYDEPTSLVDWIDPDAFENALGSSDQQMYLSARIWDHRVVITGDEVRIYGVERE